MKYSINDMEKILNVFGKKYSSIHMYFLKHLNRYGKCRLEVPDWHENKWARNKILFINELNKNAVFKNEFLIENKVNLTKNYRIFCTIVNIRMSTKQLVFCENRDDIFNIYIDAMKDASTFQKLIKGVN